ncbi:TIGR03773 family transporter-associated surface protein [Phytoactinopolyspora limicola]|uniref:TIGR03773 family transporter-associated surface protein n=1 Tax=Phytoactinopolyspora limicola TaxID=2715536 RepID=UPI0014087843|nr:TIGR03773 family transporter-associated surface protein [Phytoactinopolyspora limicola]
MYRHTTRSVLGVTGAVALAAALVLTPALAAGSALVSDHASAGSAAPPPEVSERRLLTNEHVDAINVGVDGAQLTINSKISPPVEFVEVDELIYQLSDLSYMTGLPDQFVEFIGADSAWIVPQVQNHDVLWAGWSTENIAAGALDGNSVDITLLDVQGPGDVEVWQMVGFSEIRRIFSSDENYKTLSQSVNAHVHANWAFTEPGVYTLTFGAAASVGGQRLESDPVDFTWVVGGTSGELPALAASATQIDAPSIAEPGEDVTLHATVGTDTGVDAPPSPGGYVEFLAGGQPLGWAALVEGAAQLTTSFGELGEYELTATYVPQEPQFYAGSTSEPHVLVVEDETEPIETTLTIDGLAHHYHSGDRIELTAVQNPPTELDHYHWFGRLADDDDFVEVGGGAVFVTEAAAELDGAQYYVELSGHGHEVVARSEPVTIVIDDHDGEPGDEDPGNEDPGNEDPGNEDPGNEDPGECEDPRTVLTNEHVDLLAPVLDDGELAMRAKVGSAASYTFYDPADLLVQVKDPEAATSVPGGDGYAFLGEEGDPLWVIPQTQDPDVVWAGWSTEELPAGTFVDDAVRMIMHDVEGPGEVEVFQSSGLGGGPTRIFSTTDTLEPVHQAVGRHVHAHWAFTALGAYTMTFEVAGTLEDGGELTTGPVEYAFVVGDVECDPDDPGDENGADEGGAEGGGDEGGAAEDGHDDGTDVGGDQSGDQAGGADGSDDGTDAGGDQAGNDDGTDAGDASGNDTGGGAGTGPKPTTKPTTGVCPPGTVPAGSRSASNPAPTGPSNGTGDAGSDDGTDAGGESGDETGDNGENGGNDAPSGDQVVLTNEHVDLISPRLSGTDVSLRAKVGSAADHTFYAPADVLTQVKPEAESTVPAGDAYTFLGAAGDPIWLIPETQDPEIVWAGWSTEELSRGEFQGDTVDIRMLDVDGPGTLEVFQTVGFGDVARIFSSEDSLAPRRQGVGQHVHANWAFSVEGSYTVTFEVSGTLAGGQTVSSGPVRYSFVVGELTGANASTANDAGGADAVAPGGRTARAAVPALHQPAMPAANLAANPTPTASPTASPTANPTSSASPAPPGATARPSSAASGVNCVLANTGAGGTSGLVVAGGLLLAGGAAALFAYRRRGVSLTA